MIPASLGVEAEAAPHSPPFRTVYQWSNERAWRVVHLALRTAFYSVEGESSAYARRAFDHISTLFMDSNYKMVREERYKVASSLENFARCLLNC